MDYIKVSAKTVDDAIIEASIQLGTSSDNIEYEVIQAASTGFLGIIGSKPAIIQARKKVDDSLDFEEAVKEPLKNMNPRKEIAKKTVKKAVKDQPKQNEKKQEKKMEKKPEKAEKPVAKQNVKPIQKPVVKSAEAPVAAVEEKKPAQPVKEPKAPVNKEEAQEAAKKFLKEMFAAMDMEVTIQTSFDKEENMIVDLSGTDMGILIGKRGQTLDSIQYLTSLVVNKGNNSYVRVKVDTENYRARRKETLENLAKNIAFKVKRTRKPVFLEPMNPYERRVIHSALQNDPQISTHSEGEEPYRKVVVTLKKSNNTL